MSGKPAQHLAPDDGRESGTQGNGGPRRKVTNLASPSDDLNKEIIRLLQDDGRLPYDVIATKLGVSAGTVRNRVQWMREAGMLSIVAVVDPIATDYAVDAMLGLKVAPGITPKAVAERLQAFPEVVYIIWVSGRFDLLVELVCDADKAFTEFLNEQIHDQPDIAHVEVMTCIDMFKNQFLLKRHVI